MGLQGIGSKKRLLSLVLCAGGLVSGLSPALAAPGQAAAGPQDAPAVDPNAIKALEEMGGFLRSLPAFAITAETTTDEVLDSGQKIQLSSEAELRARRPDKLRVDIKSDRKQRQFFYDGKTFTVNGPKGGYYASFDAPPTLAQTIATAEHRYGVEIPLVDLFYWGTDKSGIKDIQSAIDVGPATIDGVETEQYAFKQQGVDWQVWIEKGDKPLPRKLVITNTQDPTQPQHVAVLDWNLKPNVGNAVFAFNPPKGSHRIQFDAGPSNPGRSP
ncbi:MULTISPECIES: DUF2092 domain-containing protein [unclassified Myxococcus]|uniref:DUF2092 domain-containing protein n=1 Tax=unclassified Myxococcus TaxID=2648731 RepID=UPI00157A5B25|nr:MULTISPECIES: DUF2092 domain-containing protein [unclassified Myxococcus]NTX36724.1 DUF2092 domain-containing protein [Myxococcus sp. CA033]NTX49785.1 DUF2092 domain-containing protein [Myxococcus sp. CA039A]